MEGSRSIKRMKTRLCLVRHITINVCFLLLMLCCVLPVAAKPALRLSKLGVDDVHDEQSVQDRLKVMAILRQLQAASIAKVESRSSVDTTPKVKAPGPVPDNGAAPHPLPTPALRPSHPSPTTTPTDITYSSATEATPISATQQGTSAADRTDNDSINTATAWTLSPTDTSQSPTDTTTQNTSCAQQVDTNTNVTHKPALTHSPKTGQGVLMGENSHLSMTPASENTKDRAENSIADSEGDQRSRPMNTSGETDVHTADDQPMEVGLLFEGDIMLSAADAEEVLHAGQTRRKRKVTYSQKKRWSLPIPYLFDQTEKFRLNSSEMSQVKGAIAHLESLTCITFREVNATDPVRPILSFKKDAGCWSYVGKERAFQFQEVSTGEGCFEIGTLLHELGHAIGFWHEHSRPDREGFIRVHTDRVRLGEEFNFKIESWGELDNMNVPYDVGSIMHYGSTYFSRSGREVTVESLDPRLQRALGQRLEMSFYDVKLANLAYCQAVCNESTVECKNEGYPDPKNCNRCRCPPGLTGINCQKVAYNQDLTCGGRLIVDKGQRYSISSPSHPWLYPANIACSWLIETTPGRQIVMRVDQQHFMTHPTCSPYPTTVCTDYLEVKYNISFGYTGARYCCGVPPREALRSSGNRMLVLFRTRHTGQGGFLATIMAESCGGCHAGPAVQPACRKREEWQCNKLWNVTQYVPCPVYFKSSSNCNTLVKKQMSRLALCTSEVEYCCDGYQVTNGLCYPSSNTKTSSRPLTQGYQPDMNTGDTEIGQDADSTWSAWSPWQPCSKTCGGCGVQTRQRTCDIPTQCGGKSIEEESRTCNTFPCPDVVVFMCTTTRVKEFYCGWGRCYRRVTKTGPCYSNCCAGYVEVQGKCVRQKS